MSRPILPPTTEGRKRKPYRAPNVDWLAVECPTCGASVGVKCDPQNHRPRRVAAIRALNGVETPVASESCQTCVIRNLSVIQQRSDLRHLVRRHASDPSPKTQALIAETKANVAFHVSLLEEHQHECGAA
jgi:hypothetical protein